MHCVVSCSKYLLHGALILFFTNSCFCLVSGSAVGHVTRVTGGAVGHVTGVTGVFGVAKFFVVFLK